MSGNKFPCEKEFNYTIDPKNTREDDSSKLKSININNFSSSNRRYWPDSIGVRIKDVNEYNNIDTNYLLINK